jgi:hypothetical protein
MFNIFKWYQEYQLQKLTIKAGIANKPYEMIAQLAHEQAEASKEQSRMFQEWLKGFNTTAIPTSSVTRDWDEYQSEQDRLVQALNENSNVDLARYAAENLRNLQ